MAIFCVKEFVTITYYNGSQIEIEKDDCKNLKARVKRGNLFSKRLALLR
jgi:hypothetical protein